MVGGATGLTITPLHYENIWRQGSSVEAGGGWAVVSLG